MPFPTYKTQAEIPEGFRDEYVEHEGAWHAKSDVDLDVERKKRAALLDEKKDEERRRKEAERERDELKRTRAAEAAGISEAALQEIRNAEAAARKPIEEELAATRTENRKLKLTDRVQVLALKYGVMPDRIEDAMLLLDPRTDLTDKDGIAVKDREGKVTTETIDDFLKTTFKKEKPWLYAGTGASGSGASGTRGAPDPEEPKSDPTEVERRRSQVRSAF